MALGVIVPVLNEAATVRQLLQRVLLQKVVAEVIVVDDGSTDGTADILAQVKLSDCRVRVLHHSERRGKGAAIRTALLQVKSAVVVIQDADLEYDPADYESLLEPIRLEKAEIVYGSRFAGAGPAAGPRWHTWANGFLSWCARRITGLRISDEATCYKMCLRRVLVEMRLAENGFGFCPEFTAKAACLRARIVEVPIHYAPRTRAEGKKIRLWHGLEALVCLCRYRLFFRPAPASADPLPPPAPLAPGARPGSPCWNCSSSSPS